MSSMMLNLQPLMTVYVSVAFLIALTLIIAGPLAYARYNDPADPNKQKQFNDTVSISMIIVACLMLSPLAFTALRVYFPGTNNAVQNLTASIYAAGRYIIS